MLTPAAPGGEPGYFCAAWCPDGLLHEVTSGWGQLESRPETNSTYRPSGLPAVRGSYVGLLMPHAPDDGVWQGLRDCDIWALRLVHVPDECSDPHKVVSRGKL
ncbi:hypothetical protein NDU88_005241 [Pleurodeles waltl]|uniref:Uncharacterized protein n=1 Tax=Pleurodeles waltl TaxID=8319 RepID=A0AAV7W799_PLEWA|nr:hypothetical protein NDU88_005241 [Pleurodeles waltl]